MFIAELMEAEDYAGGKEKDEELEVHEKEGRAVGWCLDTEAVMGMYFLAYPVSQSE